MDTKRFGYMACNITVSDLIDTSGRYLFRKLCSSEHSLHHLLPPERKYSNLRNRGHPRELPEYCTNLHKKSFIIQSLYLYIWFLIFNICELSFNGDLAHCWRAFDMSNKYYLLTYLFVDELTTRTTAELRVVQKCQVVTGKNPPGEHSGESVRWGVGPAGRQTGRLLGQRHQISGSRSSVWAC